MRFKADRFPGLSVFVRDEYMPRHPVTGDQLGKDHPDYRKPIIVSFAVHRGEFKYVDPMTGREEIGADIAGGFFDSVEAQQREGWTDDEREMVERRLLSLSETWSEAVQPYEEAPVAVPWPTYDAATNYLEIASLAEKLGLLGEALAYERQNKNRDGVVKALEAKLADKQADETLVAA